MRIVELVGCSLSGINKAIKDRDIKKDDIINMQRQGIEIVLWYIENEPSDREERR